MYFFILQNLLSPVLDIWIFFKISKIKFEKIDNIFVTLFIILSFVIGSGLYLSDFLIDFLQSIAIFIYFYRRNLHSGLRKIIGSILVFELLDLMTTILAEVSILIINNINVSVFLLIEEVIVFLMIMKYSTKIHKILVDRNSTIFISLILYIYVSSAIVYSIALEAKQLSEVFEVSLSLLILQILFAIFSYIAMVKLQKNLLSKEVQEKQELQLKLEKAKNNELVLRQQQLKIKNEQLQEYTDYLDKNEDELRRFKHDYQNILNGIKLEVEEGNTKAIIQDLEEYSHSQFDQKALRKYKDVNHIHERNLKSIVIAKLTKLYNLNINYSFGCDKNIYYIPKTVDILDLIRIIGIAFDNAIEESQFLISETDNKYSAQVDAMYYQENNDFEFEIRNKIRNKKIDIKHINKKNYTTKDQHMGLGLANVKTIAHKYEKSMFINYSIQNGWFIFNLTILPDEKWR